MRPIWPCQIGQQIIEGAPDLVIEMLSPTITRQDLQEKLCDYQSIGVREAWIIAPAGRTVEVLQLSPEAVQRSGLYGSVMAFPRACCPTCV
jgi:Uma2 family endonuclease